MLFPTNGVGLGHFTRLFAVARQIRKQDQDVEIVFVTTMSALHLVESEGFASYHLPGKYMFNEMTSAEWNAITEEILGTVFEIHRPSIFVFDGAFPYRGMLNAINNRKGLTNFWLRRGTFKKVAQKSPWIASNISITLFAQQTVHLDLKRKLSIKLQSEL